MQDHRLTCPSCGNLEHNVVTTARTTDGQTVRRRHCSGCDHRWYTLQPREAQLPNHRVQWVGTGRRVIQLRELAS